MEVNSPLSELHSWSTTLIKSMASRRRSRSSSQSWLSMSEASETKDFFKKRFRFFRLRVVERGRCFPFRVDIFLVWVAWFFILDFTGVAFFGASEDCFSASVSVCVPDIDPRKLERPGLLRRGEEKGQAGLFSSETVLGSTIGALSCPSGCRPFFLEGRGSFVDGA